MSHVTNSVVGTNMFTLSKANVIKGMHFHASACYVCAGDVMHMNIAMCVRAYIVRYLYFQTKSHYPSVCQKLVHQFVESVLLIIYMYSIRMCEKFADGLL